MKFNTLLAKTLSLVTLSVAMSACNVSTNADGTCSSALISDYTSFKNKNNPFAADYAATKVEMAKYDSGASGHKTKSQMIDLVVGTINEADETLAECENFSAAHKDAVCQATYEGESKPTEFKSQSVEDRCTQISTQQAELTSYKNNL